MRFPSLLLSHGLIRLVDLIREYKSNKTYSRDADRSSAVCCVVFMPQHWLPPAGNEALKCLLEFPESRAAAL